MRKEGYEEGCEIGHAEGCKEGYEEGCEIGREMGREEGLEEGQKKGREEGREEWREESREEIERLQKENRQLKSQLAGESPLRAGDSLEHISNQQHCTSPKPNIAPNTMFRKAVKKVVAIDRMKPKAFVAVSFVIEGSGVDNPGPMSLPRSSSITSIVSKVPGLTERTPTLYVDGDMHELDGKERLGTLVKTETTL